MTKSLIALISIFLLALLIPRVISKISWDNSYEKGLYQKIPLHENTIQSVWYIEGGTPLKMILTPERKLTTSEISGYPWRRIARYEWNQGSKRHEHIMPDMYSTREGFILLVTSVSLKMTMGNQYLFIVTPTRSTNCETNVQYLFLRFITSEIN